MIFESAALVTSRRVGHCSRKGFAVRGVPAALVSLWFVDLECDYTFLRIGSGAVAPGLRVFQHEALHKTYVTNPLPST